ncbi:MAG: hypothetical protein LBI31_03785 [Zoogloeaceae bacterium]|jgi:hypothetical protein|nr:hypothetical protein [Zoogloeaceae bacterium]
MPGDYFSGSGKCLARITGSDMGGFPVLSISREEKSMLEVNDLTGFL